MNAGGENGDGVDEHKVSQRIILLLCIFADTPQHPVYVPTTLQHRALLSAIPQYKQYRQQ